MGLSLLPEHVEEHPGRLLDRAPDVILAPTPKQKEKVGERGSRSERQAGREEEKKKKLLEKKKKKFPGKEVLETQPGELGVKPRAPN